MPGYYVAWWNLENLFDEENSPRRTEKVARVNKNDIAGWTPALRNRKITQLASVIAHINAGTGPDLLGVCEVENRFVLDLLADAVRGRLPDRQYRIVHADTDDARGIDVAFLYDPSLLQVPAADGVFFHVVMRRNATREIVQVNFQTHTGRTWAVFGNHWPVASSSRRDTGRSPGRPWRSSISGSWRSTARTRRCWRWATSTTNRSTSPWSRTR